MVRIGSRAQKTGKNQVRSDQSDPIRQSPRAMIFASPPSLLWNPYHSTIISVATSMDPKKPLVFPYVSPIQKTKISNSIAKPFANLRASLRESKAHTRRGPRTWRADTALRWPIRRARPSCLGSPTCEPPRVGPWLGPWLDEDFWCGDGEKLGQKKP